MTGQKKTSPVDSVDVLCLVMSFCAMSDDDESNDDDEDEQCVCGGEKPNGWNVRQGQIGTPTPAPDRCR